MSVTIHYVSLLPFKFLKDVILNNLNGKKKNIKNEVKRQITYKHQLSCDKVLGN